MLLLLSLACTPSTPTVDVLVDDGRTFRVGFLGEDARVVAESVARWTDRPLAVDEAAAAALDGLRVWWLTPEAELSAPEVQELAHAAFQQRGLGLRPWRNPLPRLELRVEATPPPADIRVVERGTVGGNAVVRDRVPEGFAFVEHGRTGSWVAIGAQPDATHGR